MPDDVLKDALERFKQSEDGSTYNRQAALDDTAFARLAEQWPDEIKRQREQEGRPILTINRLPSFIRQVVNDARQNSPSIKVVPVDSGADVATADVYSGIIRSIERGSNAAVAYDTALEHAVTGGFGFFRITTDYCHAESFDMEARIERVANPLSVHWDTNSTQFDASDWEYAFVSDLLTEAEFKRKYPKAQAVSFEGAANGDDDLAMWFEDNKVRIAEYFLREEYKAKVLLLSDGRVVKEDDLKKPVAPGGPSAAEVFAMGGVVPTRERESTFYKVTRRVISGAEVLEETPWAGSTIPICPVWGEEVIYRGRRWFRSLVRDARDPQKMFNFWRSASTELVALAPRAPFMMAKGAMPRDAKERAKWESANTRSHAYLTYEADGAAPMPQRQPFAGVPAGALQEALNAADDMKSVMGIYDASLGARSNETSGRAIMARQREGDNATFHFIDNLSRAIQYCGRCLVELIPQTYGARQVVQILGDNEEAKVVRLVQEGALAVQPGEGNEKAYNLNVGKYDVAVKTGPSYTTQREETREFLTEIISRTDPQVGLVLSDLAVSTMDFPGADKAAKRLRALLPPQVLAAEQEGEDGMPAEAQAMIASAQQQVQQLQAALAEAQAAAQDKQGDREIKMRELGIKQQEVQLKGAELVMRQQDAQRAAQEKAVSDAAEAESDAAEDAMEQQEKAAMVGALQAIAQGQAVLADAVMQGNAQLGQGIAQVAALVSAPRRLVRDGAGKPAGSELAFN
jgi:hypothetical protein